MVIIESRSRDYRQPWTGWVVHHEQPTMEDAKNAIRWLKQMDAQAKRDGEESRFFRAEYRIAE